MVKYSLGLAPIRVYFGASVILNALRTRLPSRQELFPVLAVFVFFAYTWALYRMFWYVPSWLEYLNLWKVLTIAAYVLAFALFESLLMLGLLVLFSLFFPPRIFKDRFIVQGASLAALTSLAAFMLQRKINLVYRLELWQLELYPLVLLVALVFVVLALGLLFERLPFLARLVQAIAERLTIFAYFYLPLGLLGLAVVILRNLIGD
jgi:hypothetical protein